jgi:ubiquitin-protein ligase E3 D
MEVHISAFPPYLPEILEGNGISTRNMIMTWILMQRAIWYIRINSF